MKLLNEHMCRANWRMLLVVATLAIYALFSAPTPDTIGAAEVVIAFLLIITVGAKGAIGSLIIKPRANIFDIISQFSFFYMAIVTTAVGIVFQNNDVSAFIRDIIPMLYMFLFLFLRPHFQSQQFTWIKLLSLGLLLIGVSFSVRFFLNSDIKIAAVGSQVFRGDINYFPVSPSVTFGAFFGMLEGFRMLETKKPIKALGFFIASAVCISSIAAMLLRAPLILFALTLFGRVLTSRTSDTLGLLIKAGMILLIVLALPFFDPIWQLVQKKFSEVGSNGKFEEFNYVMDLAFSSTKNVFFGVGWGGAFYSPIFKTDVRYTHQIIAFLMIKVGIVGLVFAIVIVWFGFIKSGFNFLTARLGTAKKNGMTPSVQGASFAALASPIFLQASYKSFDFGLILLVVLIANGTLNPGRTRTRRRAHSTETEYTTCSE